MPKGVHITKKTAQDIRRSYMQSDLTISQIGELYGLHRSTVSRIVSGKGAWEDFTPLNRKEHRAHKKARRFLEKRRRNLPAQIPSTKKAGEIAKSKIETLQENSLALLKQHKDDIYRSTRKTAHKSLDQWFRDLDKGMEPLENRKEYNKRAQRHSRARKYVKRYAETLPDRESQEVKEAVNLLRARSATRS